MLRPARLRPSLVPALLALAALGCVAPEAAPPPSPPSVSEALMPLNGTELFVKRMGSGEPVIVLHGGPVLDHGYLLPHIAPLADKYELVLADQRASGRSTAEVPPESLRLATLVADIEALRVDLDLGRVHLLAHSWGGLLALHYALEHEEAVRSITLVSPLAASAALWQEEQQAQAAAAAPKDQAARQEILASDAFAAQEPEAIKALLRLAFAAQFHDRARAADLELYVPPDYMARSRLYGNLMPELADYDLHPRLAALEVPTMVLFGADEAAAELGGAALERTMPHSSLVLLEASGHFSFIERQADFLRLVDEFLASID